jgi:hypothetical protein
MGLTIHYDLKTNLTKPQDIRQLVESMRQHALDLPFKEVSEIKEFTGPETSWETEDDPDRWLKIQTAGHASLGQTHYRVPALNIVALHTWPGEGCEQANFGFCQYPAYFKPEKRRIATNLIGWQWHSFCKTQYASDPKCGGTEYFLRCHLCVIKMLDFIKQTGHVEVEVSDESDYWQHRDIKKLAQKVGEWNELVAGVASELRSTADAEGKNIVAPITGFPNFEHLEAKGLERIAELRRKLQE